LLRRFLHNGEVFVLARISYAREAASGRGKAKKIPQSGES